MKRLLAFAWAVLGVATAGAADPALTIYNQNFAVVRGSIDLDLKVGENDIRVQDVTRQLEPDSVILRDPSGKSALQILEQNYRNDPVSQGLLLDLNEGKTITFQIAEPNKPDRSVQGKIIRSGYVSPALPVRNQFGQVIYNPQPNGPSEPIVEIDGVLRFGLPGLPIFPSLGDDTILKPELSWKLNSTKAAKIDAELCYVTGGMTWEASYNVVASEKNDLIDLVGWVTMENHSGKTFEKAKIKLMAGDVNKLQPGGMNDEIFTARAAAQRAESVSPAAVTEKAFDEYHLYSLARPATLHDGETKQIEFVRATGVQSQKIFVYDGLKIDWNRWGGEGLEGIRRNEELGTDSDTKVAVVREFKNSEANRLGIPLPAGRLRFYQQDDDTQLEFIGENRIDHTPKDETIRVVTGNAFDLVGERRRTDFKVDSSNHWLEEAYEIKLRNHKKEAVEIRVVEHLFRWVNWDITEKSNAFLKTNAQEMEFRIQLKPDEEKIVTYRVHYSW